MYSPCRSIRVSIASAAAARTRPGATASVKKKAVQKRIRVTNMPTACRSGALRRKPRVLTGRSHPAFEAGRGSPGKYPRSEEHTSELQSHSDLVWRLLPAEK